MDDDALLALLGDAPSTAGWGCSRPVTIDGVPVFSKSVPLTARELEQRTTLNLFDLPTWYSYGVGSAGFGVFRELAMHQRTTSWVLDGAIETLPLTYHHRILPRTGAVRTRSDEELDTYQAAWDGSAVIREFVAARQDAPFELVLFLEHVPHVLHTWLEQNLEAIPEMVPGMRRTLEFLRRQGVIHFDAHLANILTDGERLFLVDFGLALDRRFDLSPAERAFFDGHQHYDPGLFLTCLFRPVYALRRGWGDEQRQRMADRLGDTSIATLVEHLDLLIDERQLSMPPGYRDLLHEHAGVAVFMDRFLGALTDGPRASCPFDDATVAMLVSGDQPGGPSPPRWSTQ